MKVRLSLILLVLLATIQATPQQLTQQTDWNTATQNMTFGELSAKWFQWAFSMSWDHNPLFDTADCSAGQSGPVWFLGGQFCQAGNTTCGAPVRRTCQIPRGKVLFFPILNTDYSFIENDVSYTEGDLRQHAKSDMNQAVNLKATIDGRKVPIIRICASGSTCSPTESPLTPFTLAGKDNMMGALPEFVNADASKGPIPDGAYSLMVTDGHYVLLPPLSPGWHTVYFHGEAPVWGFVLDVTYYVKVVM